jgi:hypothetical protein
LRVFLSYRRDDSAPRAGRLRDALAARFGDGNIFQDVVAVVPGERFTDAIESALGRSDATIAVIGPGWLAAVDADGAPRLTNPGDYVRRELASALSRPTPTIPVLVGDAEMPTAEQLPAELQALVLRQAITLRDETWHEDVERLVRALRGTPGRKPNTGRLVAAGIAVIAVLASGVALWLRRDASDGSNESRATTPAASTVFDPFTALLPACVTPQLPHWIDLEMSGRTKQDASWRFEVIDVYQRVSGTDDQDIIVETRATNLNHGSLTHYPFYALLVDGDRFTPSCFSISSGPTQVDPGGASEALVGFTGPRQPPTTMSLDVNDSGANYRVDVTANTAA